MQLLTERYADLILGTLACLDRVIITGTVPGICYAEGMEDYLYKEDVRIYDYAQFAKPFGEQIRANAEELARKNGLTIENIRSPRGFRKEDRIEEILKQRGSHPGLVHIFSAMEECPTYSPYRNPKGVPKLRGRPGKCTHFYFYFIHAEYGLCYLRVPTWCPFGLQFYFNGHNWLANQMRKEGIPFTQVDNAFIDIGDWERAQQLANKLSVPDLHQELNRLALQYCPVIQNLRTRDNSPIAYHWSVSQVECATDIVFRTPQDLQPIYEQLTRTAIHAVKPEHVATFLGRKVTAAYEGDITSRFCTRLAGTSIKHYMDEVSIGMYDKYNRILRMEGCCNNLNFFKHYRMVEHRDGTSACKVASMRKSIYSLHDVQEAFAAATRRYLQFLSALDDPTAGMRNLDRLTAPVRQNGRSYRGFNLFSTPDLELLRAVVGAHYTIRGFRNKDIRQKLPNQSPSKVSRMLKRLHLHGLIRKTRNCYRYYLTKLGYATILGSLAVRQLIVIPALARTP